MYVEHDLVPDASSGNGKFEGILFCDSSSRQHHFDYLEPLPINNRDSHVPLHSLLLQLSEHFDGYLLHAFFHERA